MIEERAELESQIIQANDTNAKLGIMNMRLSEQLAALQAERQEQDERIAVYRGVIRDLTDALRNKNVENEKLRKVVEAAQAFYDWSIDLDKVRRVSNDFDVPDDIFVPLERALAEVKRIVK